MSKPTLDQLFGAGYPNRVPAQHHTWLTAQERRFILWGQKERWPATRIASALGVNEATVRRFRSRYWTEPGLILELDLCDMVGRAKDEEFRCLVCEERVLTQREMQRHILGHFLDEQQVNEFLPKARKRTTKQTR